MPPTSENSPLCAWFCYHTSILLKLVWTKLFILHTKTLFSTPCNAFETGYNRGVLWKKLYKPKERCGPSHITRNIYLCHCWIDSSTARCIRHKPLVDHELILDHSNALYVRAVSVIIEDWKKSSGYETWIMGSWFNHVAICRRIHDMSHTRCWFVQLLYDTRRFVQ